MENFKYKGDVNLDPGERGTFKPQGLWESMSDCELNCGYHTFFLTSPKAVRGILWFPYRPLKCWLKIQRLPVISPTKMNLFKMSREIQSEVCNHCKPHASSCTRETVLQGRKGRPEGTVKKQSVSFMGWALDRKEGESFFFLMLCYPPRSWEHPILVSQICLTEISVYCGSAGKESTCSMGDLGFIPGLRRSPGEGKGYPLQYSGLENSMDCIVHGVAMSQRRLSNFHFASLH